LKAKVFKNQGAKRDLNSDSLIIERCHQEKLAKASTDTQIFKLKKL
jgi:hypothetical protein